MLKSYYEGEDYVDSTMQDNLAKIRGLFYEGETPKFNFDKIIQNQMQCYKSLCNVGYNNGKGVDDATMCTDLTSSIIPAANLEVTLSLARNRGIISNDYERLVQFFKAEIESRSRRSKMFPRYGKGRSFSAMNYDQSGGKRPGRDRGRGRGKNIRNNSVVLTKNVDGKVVRSSSYPMEEYKKLSKRQKDAVKELRTQAKDQRKSGSGENSNPT